MLIPSVFPRADRSEILRGVKAPCQSKEDGVTTVVFDSPQELAEWYLQIGKVAVQGSANERDGWSGGWSLSDSIRACFEGWKEGAARLRAASSIADRSLQFEAPEQTTEHAVAGSIVDVGAFLSGQPECMLEFVEQDRPVRRCRIVIDGFVSSNVSPSVVEARGRAVAAAAMALQAQGVIAEVVIRERYRNPDRSNETLDISVNVWKSGRTMDLGVLAATIVHPGFTRRLWFQAQWWTGAQTCGGLSHFGDRLEMPLEPGDVLISYLTGRTSHEWEGEGAADRFVKRCFDGAR